MIIIKVEGNRLGKERRILQDPSGTSGERCLQLAGAQALLLLLLLLLHLAWEDAGGLPESFPSISFACNKSPKALALGCLLHH